MTSLDSVMYFSSKKLVGRCLSNFHFGDIVITDGKEVITYSTGEHAFHGEKFRRLGKVCRDNIRKQQLFEYGKLFRKGGDILTAMDAKKNGGKRGLLLNEDEISVWNNVGIYVQREICQWKTDNFTEVKQFLNEHRDKTLIHSAFRCSEDKLHGRFWEGKAISVNENGELNILGQNMLGRIWMFVRDECDSECK